MKNKLWIPKKDDWCWFWNNHNDFPNCRQPKLFQFSYMFNEQYVNKSTCGDNSYPYDNCESFIGELPSFIKENEGK